MCFIYHTHSEIGGIPRVHYFYSNDGNTLTPDMVYLTSGDVNNYVVYNWYSMEISRLQSTNTLARGYEGHVYAVVSPFVNGWAFLGEPNKYVSCSTLRFQTITASSSELSVQVQGVRGETVTVCVARTEDLARKCQTVSYSVDGTKVVIFSK